MIILGVDPGTLITGYGIITQKNKMMLALSSGIIDLRKTGSIPVKLEAIYETLASLIKKYQPDDFAIETAFFGKNVQSALKIGIARGAAILSAQHHHLKIHEYSPREVKKSVTGNGAASKEQVSGMLKTLLNMKQVPVKFDESDALAVALCHAFRKGAGEKRSASWSSFAKQHPERIIG